MTPPSPPTPWDWKTLLANAGLALTTSFLTVRLSIRQFRSQRWWERKLEAYQNIMNALTAIVRNANSVFVKNSEGITISPERQERLDEEASLGWDELDRADVAGTFFISEKAHAAIQQVMKVSDYRTEDYMGYLDELSAAVGQAIKVVDIEAKTDLGITWRLFSRLKAVRRKG